MPRPSKAHGAQASDAARDRAIASDLAAWFRSAARDLPWRASPRNAYHALVAEAMLQQTQVSRVVDYFHRFIARFPNVASLAAAPESDVLALWSGLGYYRRARLLHAAAKAIVSDHHGQVPSDAAALAALPGIGPYTAGAIASIVFDRPAPLVDGNVLRVLQRLDARDNFASERDKSQWAWARAAQLVQAAASHPAAGPAAFNEGLMELGATICLPPPARPDCTRCPLSASCAALARGKAASIPSPRKRAVQTQAHCLTLVIRDRRGRIALEQRPDTGMWAGLWQCPTLDLTAAPTPADAAGFAAIRLADPATLQSLGHFTHSTTHRRLQFVVFQAAAVPCRRRNASRQWFDPADKASLERLGLSNAQRRVLAMANAAVGSP